ncbi:hypothetical protein [Bosea sp. Root670]|uniref:hypothetical protein n=1 Tax=Bosea sp. Root670 TaxID=1736583 RepID=UPI0012E34C3F|nr:hypothetical protein [Bosea sp. Root670]
MAALLHDLNNLFGPLSTNTPPPVNSTPATGSNERLGALLDLCPCLFNQINMPPTSRAIVHFCESSIGARITDANVMQAFKAQLPKATAWKYAPAGYFTGRGGDVMEYLCSEVLNNGGIPQMAPGDNGWPEWSMPGHILLNEGKMQDLKALGDILIPCAPTNLIVSVKSVKAKERLLYSANSIEGIGYGFFDSPEEFWTVRRMQLFKRMGFSAIYLPDDTLAKLTARLIKDKTRPFAVNINGTPLYRPLTQFTSDMRKVVGKSAFDL